MSRHAQVDVIYIDISKAFDSVNHRLLLAKLSNVGLSPLYVKWFKSYLSSRTCQIKIGLTKSTKAHMNNGIPQGSPLGPLLFSIFLNDITENITNSQVLLYADDLKVFRVVNNSNDNAMLQKDLDNISDWCRLNLMKINCNKTNFMSYTNKVQYYVSKYFICNNVVNKVDYIRDLGVTFDRNLRFDLHVYNIIQNTRKLIGFIFRQWYIFKNPSSYILLYKMLIRSKLEFASAVWNSITVTLSSSLEMVQKCFIRILCFKLGLPYYAHNYDYWVQYWKLETLVDRRKNNDAIFLANVLSNKYTSRYIVENICFKVPLYNTRYNNVITPINRKHSVIGRLASYLNEHTALFK
jgi:hypothetical protein